MGFWNKLSRAFAFDPDNASNNTFEFSDLFSGTGVYNAMFNWGESGPSVDEKAGSILSDVVSQYGNNQQQREFLDELRQLQKDSAAQQMEYQTQSAERAMQFSAEQQQQLMDYNERMANTAYQRGVADMKKAGINPILAAGGGSFAAATPAASAAAGVAQSGSQAEVSENNYALQYLQTILQGFGSIYNSSASIHNTSTQAKVQMFSSLMNSLSGIASRFIPTKIIKG